MSSKCGILLLAMGLVSACDGRNGAAKGGGTDGGNVGAEVGDLGTPQNLRLAAGSGFLLLSWDPVVRATGYRVYWNTSGNVTREDTVVSVATNQFLHDNLNSTKQYHYIVTAVDADGESADSSPVTGFPQLVAPAGLAAARGDGRVTLTWDPVPGATSYTLYWSDTETATAASNKLGNVESPFEHRNLKNDATYSHVVAAVDPRGESSVSAEVVSAPFPMEVPTGLLGLQGDASAILRWTPVDGVNTYNLYWKQDEAGVTPADNLLFQSFSPFEHTGLAPGSTYYYVVTSVYLGGESAVSPEIAVVAREAPPYGAQREKLAALDRAAGDEYGVSVDVDGDYAVIGAGFENGGPGDPLPQAGAAYVHFRSPVTEDWDEGFKLVAPDAEAGDLFGVAAAISGDAVIVGAYMEDGGPGSPLSDAGAAYVFDRTAPNEWGAGTRLVPFDEQLGSRFGVAVDIDGDYAIVGAYQQSNTAGAAYVFHRDGGGVWDGGSKLVAADAEAGKWFGISVAISGDYAIVGAYSPFHSDPGAAYVFRRTDVNSWDGGTKLVGPAPSTGDNFGFDVGIDGDTAIVGAGWTDTVGAYVFDRTDVNTWQLVADLTPSGVASGDDFGNSVAVLGDHALVGARFGASFEQAGTPLAGGAVYVFERDGLGNWGPGERVISTDVELADAFGTSVALSADWAIVGASAEDGGFDAPLPDSGAAYVFEK